MQRAAAGRRARPRRLHRGQRVVAARAGGDLGRARSDARPRVRRLRRRRVGPPRAAADVEVHVRYSRGTVAHRGGRSRRRRGRSARGLALAETAAPEQIPAIIQGLGLALEERGEYAEAVATYRRALTALAARGGDPAQEQLFRGRLAICLAHVGDPGAAAESRAAVALADRVLDARHPDRAIAHLNHAEVLHAAPATTPRRWPRSTSPKRSWPRPPASAAICTATRWPPRRRSAPPPIRARRRTWPSARARSWRSTPATPR
jgi:hypothetical protein